MIHRRLEVNPNDKKGWRVLRGARVDPRFRLGVSHTAPANGPGERDTAIWRVSPPPTHPHNVADLSECVEDELLRGNVAGRGARTAMNGYVARSKGTSPLLQPLALTGSKSDV